MKISQPTTITGGGGGTVTSVGLSFPSTQVFNVTNSPITTAGTIAVTFTSPGAQNVLVGVDFVDGDMVYFNIGSGLSYDHATHTLSSTGGSVPDLEAVTGVGNTTTHPIVIKTATLDFTDSGTAGDGLSRIFAGTPAGGNTIATLVGDMAGDGSTLDAATYVGNNAGRDSTGLVCTAVGYGALWHNTGDFVIGIGDSAGDSNTFSNVVLMGSGASASADNQVVFSHEIAGPAFANGRIGFGALTTNRLYTLQDASGTLAFLSDITTPGIDTVLAVGQALSADRTIGLAGHALILSSTINSTATNDFKLINGIAATSGQQQYSPFFYQKAEGWTNNGGGSSRALEARFGVITTANPSGSGVQGSIIHQIAQNGGAFATWLTVNNAGAPTFASRVTAPGFTLSGGDFNSGGSAGVSGNVLVSNGSGSQPTWQSAPTPGIDSVLAVGQTLTSSRSMGLGGNQFDIDGTATGLKFDPGNGVSQIGDWIGNGNSTKFVIDDASQQTTLSADVQDFNVTDNGIFSIWDVAGGTIRAFQVDTINDLVNIFPTSSNWKMGVGTSTPVTTLQVAGSLSVAIQEVASTTNYTVLAGDHTLVFDTTGALGLVDVILEDPTTVVGKVVILKAAIGTLGLNVTATSSTIDGSGSNTVAMGTSRQYQAGTTGWWIISQS